jgi:hypothetical protein
MPAANFAFKTSVCIQESFDAGPDKIARTLLSIRIKWLVFNSLFEHIEVNS